MTDEQQRAAIAEASWNAQADHYNQWCDLGDDERADWIAGKIEGSPWSTISETETVAPINSPEKPDSSDTPRTDAKVALFEEWISSGAERGEMFRTIDFARALERELVQMRQDWASDHSCVEAILKGASIEIPDTGTFPCVVEMARVLARKLAERDRVIGELVDQLKNCDFVFGQIQNLVALYRADHEPGCLAQIRIQATEQRNYVETTLRRADGKEGV